MYKVEISARTIIFTVTFLLLLYFLWIIQDLIFSLFIAFILMSALRPLVLALERRKVPKTLAVMTIYISFIFLFAFLFSLIIPPIIIETSNLINNFPTIMHNINPTLYNWFNIGSLTQYLPDATNNIIRILSSLFSHVFFIISTLFFGFYLLLQENVLKQFLTNFFEDHRTNKVVSTIEKAEKRMSSWFWGEVQLMTVVGCFSFIGLNIIGMPYVLPLAVLAGLLEVVPNIGPLLSALPAILIGFSHSYVLGLSAIIVYIIVQQLENNLIVPIVMKNAVGINPLITLIALVIGGKIGGVLGVLLAIPVYLFIETLAMQLLKGKNIKEMALPTSQSGNTAENIRK